MRRCFIKKQHLKINKDFNYVALLLKDKIWELPF